MACPHGYWGERGVEPMRTFFGQGEVENTLAISLLNAAVSSVHTKRSKHFDQ